LRTTILIAGTFAFVLIAGLGVPAFAEVLTFEFSGVITSVDDVSDFLGGSVGVGTTWSATVQIESDAIDRSQPVGDARGEYRANSITVQIGGLQFENFSPSDDAEVLVVVTRVTQFSPNSGFVVVADQITKTAGPDLPDGEDLDFTIALTSPANIDVFPDDSLPLPASLDLDDFELKGMSLFAFSGGAFPQVVLIIGTTTSLGETCPATVNQGQGLGNSFFDLIEPSQDTDPCASADLFITKTDASDPVIRTGELIYNIKVENFGPNAAENVIVTDTLPDGVTFVSTSGCEEAPGFPSCKLGDISSDGFKQYTIKVTVGEFILGPITNEASVTSDTFDPGPARNSDSEDTTLEDPCPMVEITSHGDTATLPTGVPIEFTAQGSDPVQGDLSDSIKWIFVGSMGTLNLGTGSSIIIQLPEDDDDAAILIARLVNDFDCEALDILNIALTGNQQSLSVNGGNNVMINAAINANGINSIDATFPVVPEGGGIITFDFGLQSPLDPPSGFSPFGRVFDISTDIPGPFELIINYKDSRLTSRRISTKAYAL